MDRKTALSARYDSMIAAMGVDPARHRLRFARGDDGAAHVVPLPGGGWLWQVSDRGRVIAEARCVDDDALLYRLACDIVAEEGARFQAQQPVSGQDPRRADFARRLELVGKVSPAWRVRLAEELALWLARHPYADRPGGDGGKPRKGYLGLLVVALLVAAWAAAHIPLWRTWQVQHRLETEGFAVDATVLDRHRTDGRFADQYSLTYRYQGATRHLVGSDVVDWQTFRRVAPEGSRISVVYDPADQATSMVEGNDRAGRLLWIYAAIDGLLAFVILQGLWRLRRGAATG